MAVTKVLESLLGPLLADGKTLFADAQMKRRLPETFPV